MESQLTIKVDATLKEELTAYAKERKQSLSDFISGVLKNAIHTSDERKHITISPYVIEMASESNLPADLDDKAIFIEAMEEKHK